MKLREVKNNNFFELTHAPPREENAPSDASRFGSLVQGVELFRVARHRGRCVTRMLLDIAQVLARGGSCTTPREDRQK